jgi:hypothetical protein
MSSYDGSPFVSARPYHEMLGDIVNSSHVPRLSSYQRQLDPNNMCSSPIFVKARSVLASTSGRGGLGTDGWDNYIFGDAPPPPDEAAARLRTARVEAQRTAGLGKEEIRGGVVLERAIERQQREEVGEKVLPALQRAVRGKLAAKAAAKAVAKAAIPAEATAAKAAKKAELARLSEEFQRGAQKRMGQRAIAALEASAIQKVIEREEERANAQKGTNTTPARKKLTYAGVPRVGGLIDRRQKLAALAARGGGGAFAASAGGGGAAAAAPVAAPAVSASPLLEKALDEGVPLAAARVEKLNELAAEVGGIHIGEGRKGRYGKGYKPMVEGDDGKWYAYTDKTLTKGDLETAILRLTSVRQMADKEDKQAITNFIARVKVEIGRR